MIVALSSGTTVMAAESNEIKYQKLVEISDEELGVENIDEIQQNIMQRECSEKTYAYSGISVCSESEDTVSDTDPNNAYLVTNDTLTRGQVGVANEMRWYAFQIAEKSKISILLRMIETMDADLYMFALNSDVNFINVT
ncbi:MAG: hypothetical protein IJN64_18660 [Lachnospiraceae bacterium]|nr:hypothetical protein [Lachnospiraceae bacterium]